MGKFIDLTGKKFNRWIVIERAADHFSPCGKRHTMWLCRCNCEKQTERVVMGASLKRGLSKSCGCYELEKKMSSKYRLIHGLAGTSIYNIYQNMKARCYNPKSSRYYTHGARGIRVCPEWLDKKKGFINFYNYVSKLPHYGEKGYTLNRIDNDGDYTFGNIEWADNETQANNKRNNHLITYEGKTQTMVKWAREYKVNYKLLNQKINRDSVTFEEAIQQLIKLKRSG